MVRASLFEIVVAALERSPDVRVVTLFGSQARGSADAHSDIDLQIITSRPAAFRRAAWLPERAEPLLAYGLRPAFGGVTKATAVYADAEVDVVVLPWSRLRMARWVVRAGLHRRSARLARQLADLTIVLRPGYRVLKGGAAWSNFFAQLLREVADSRLDDETVQRMGDCAYADFVSLRRKIERGELVAAQRWLHVHLVETNLKLLHEYRSRRGLGSFHDARRLEHVVSAPELQSVTIAAVPESASLQTASREALVCTWQLVRDLTGRPPTWPLPT